MKITKTKHGLRLSQHDVVISELRTTPGPTHSVFDVLAALVAMFAPPIDIANTQKTNRRTAPGKISNNGALDGRIGLLGFAGGGMIAPLRALDGDAVIHSCDLDRSGFDLFQKHCPHWVGQVRWEHADAVQWLERHSSDFALLLDDLSIPHEGDVLKPEVSWTILPALMRRRLRPKGVAIFNLLPPRHGRWGREVLRLARQFPAACVIDLDEFENRIVVAGRKLPSPRSLSRNLRRALKRLRSRQANRIHVHVAKDHATTQIVRHA